MGNSGVDRRLVEKGKAAATAVDQDEDHSVLQEKLDCARLELQMTMALSADADETICRLAADWRRLVQEREEAFRQRNALLAELQVRRNAQAMMAALTSAGSPAAAFSNRAFAVPFGAMTVQEPYYAGAAGASYCYASSLPPTSGHDSFDPNMFLVDAAEGDSAVPATGSGAPGMEGKKKKKKKSSRSELGLVVEQILGVPRKKGEVVEASVDSESKEVEGSVDN